jgi:hypothetical protein
VESATPKKHWWRSFWFAVVAILLAVGCLAFGAALVLWALLPAIGVNAN